jgi:hypothetical protein
MEYKVYDYDKILLKTFTSEEDARRYINNNDDIAAFLNDIQVVDLPVIPVAPHSSAASAAPATPKLKTATQAIETIKIMQEHTVAEVIEQVIAAKGDAVTLASPHLLVIRKLMELGYRCVAVQDSWLVSLDFETLT